MFLARVFYDNGIRHPFTCPTLSEAIDMIGDGVGTTAELVQVDEFVEGIKTETKLADILFGEWFISDTRRLTMATVKKALASNGAGRDVAADLIGDGGGKRSKKKTAKKTAKKAKSGGGSRVSDEAKIKILRTPELREGSNRAKLFAIAKKAGTVGNYKKLKAKAGLGEGVGSFLNKMAQTNFVRISA